MRKRYARLLPVLLICLAGLVLSMAALYCAYRRADYAFPGTSWGQSPQEALSALGLKEEDMEISAPHPGEQTRDRKELTGYCMPGFAWGDIRELELWLVFHETEGLQRVELRGGTEAKAPLHAELERRFGAPAEGGPSAGAVQWGAACGAGAGVELITAEPGACAAVFHAA